IPVRVSQVVEWYPTAEVAAENVTDVRTFLQACSRRPLPGDQEAPTNYETLAVGLWGDDSLLVRVTSYEFNEEGDIVPSEHYEYVAVVWVRSAVSTVVSNDERTLMGVMPRVVDHLA